MNSSAQSQKDVWERWEGVWQVIFYASLLLSTPLMLRETNLAVSRWIPGLLTALLFLWHWGGMRLAYKDPESWNERALARFIILTIDSILWFGLVNISTVYYLVLFGLFGQVFRHLPIRYAVVSALLLTTGTIVEQMDGRGNGTPLEGSAIWLFSLLGLAGILLGIWISAIIEQSTRRRQLIEQLEATRAELAAAERREGVLEERHRLAREIHDTLAQGFTSIVMLLETAEQTLAESADSPSARHLKMARDTARSSLEQSRRLVWELRPEMLEDASLPDALQRVCTGWSDRSGVQTVFITTGQTTALHPQTEIALLRALQEALHNVEKHAGAKIVNVTLSFMPDVVMLDVTDDGAGFDPQIPPGDGHFGLVSMRERAALLGGQVMVESEKGAGTALVVEIPVREK